MNENVKQSADLFFENLEVVKNEFPWKNPDIKFLCALAYSTKGMEVDVARMKEAVEIIQNKTKIFSQFRGEVKLILAVQMAQADDMAAYFAHVNSVYEKLLENKKFAMQPEHYIVAAMVIAQNGQSGTSDEDYAVKTKSIFARMKENHPWLTNDEDLGFAAMLALSSTSEDAVTDEMESCYNYLQEKKLFSSNGIQSLSHVLSLEVGNAEGKCDKVTAVYEGLKEKKKKYGTTYELSTLGSFAYADADSQTLVDEIAEADDYLKTNKNFSGLFSIPGKQRLMYAAILVMQQHCASGAGAETAALASTISMIAAQQAAMMAILCSSIAVSSMSAARA